MIYLPKYVSPDDELFEKTDAEIEESFLTELEKMYPHFDKNDVVEFKVSRVRQVFPLPTLEYSDNVPDVKTSLENVFVINSSQITNGTLNVNETIQLAEKFFSKELLTTDYQLLDFAIAVPNILIAQPLALYFFPNNNKFPIINHLIVW